MSGFVRIVEKFIDRGVFPREMFFDDPMGEVIRFGLYLSALFQLVCFLACVTVQVQDEVCDFHSQQNERTSTDSDDYSSEHSSPGHRAYISRKKHDKKKRR